MPDSLTKTMRCQSRRFVWNESLRLCCQFSKSNYVQVNCDKLLFIISYFEHTFSIVYTIHFIKQFLSSMLASAKVDKLDKFGNTSLHHAVASGNIVMVVSSIF